MHRYAMPTISHREARVGRDRSNRNKHDLVLVVYRYLTDFLCTFSTEVDTKTSFSAGG